MNDSTQNRADHRDMPKEAGMAHTAVMIRAALPYLNPDLHRPLDLLAKGMDFLGAAKGFRLSDTLGALNLKDKDNLITDMNGLLASLKKSALPSELRILDMLSILMNIRKFYEMYQSLAPLFAGMGGDDGMFPGGWPMGAFSSATSSASADASFAPLSGLFSDPSSLLKLTEIFQAFSGGFAPNIGGADIVSDAESEPEPFPAPDPPFDRTQPENPVSSPDSSMFDLVSALIPPEQQGTFELLKQLMSPGMNGTTDNSPSESDSTANPFPVPHYTPDTLPFTIPSDLEACQVPSYPDTGRIPAIYRGGLIDPTANPIISAPPEPNNNDSHDTRTQSIA